MRDIKNAVVAEEKGYWQEQHDAASKSGSKKWVLAGIVLAAVGLVLLLSTIPAVGAPFAVVGFIAFFVGMWKHIDAGGDDFGIGASAGQ